MINRIKKSLYTMLFLFSCTQSETTQLSTEAESIHKEYFHATMVVPEQTLLTNWLKEWQISLEELQETLIKNNNKSISIAFNQRYNELILQQEQELLTLQQEARQLNNPEERKYLETLIAYWSLNFLQASLKREQQQQLLENFIAQLTPFIKKESNIADLHRLYAELHSRLMNYQAKRLNELSQLSKRHNEIATKLDPTNGGAWLNLASWYFFAPEFAGGSLSKALKLLQKSKKNQLNEGQQHWAWQLQIMIYDKQQKIEKTEQILEEALEQFPLSVQLLKARQNLAQNLPAFIN